MELKDKLIEILELRKGDYTGEDVKNVVEAIMLVDTVGNEEIIKQQSENTQALMKEWMVGGE